MPRDGASHGFHRTQRLPVGGYFFAFFAAGFFAAGFFAARLAAFVGFFATTFAAFAAGFFAAAFTAAFLTATGFAAPRVELAFGDFAALGGYAFVLGASFLVAGFLAAGFALFLVAMFFGSFLRYVSIIPLSLTPNNGLSSAITPKQPV
jgi:hypothetical protein